MMMLFRLLVASSLIGLCVSAQARTVWHCQRDGTVSLATAPEPGSQCTAKTLDDNSPLAPNLWGALGQFHGALYQREQDGKLVYSTRNLPGSTKVQEFTVATPPTSFAHTGFGKISQPQLGAYRREFASAASKTGLDEAWLRAIAHAESNYAADAVSAKGAKGLMQLVPATARRLGVRDSCNINQNVSGGVRYLAWLMRLFHNDFRLVATGYYAGEDIVARRGLSYHNADVVAYVAGIRATYALQAGGAGNFEKTISKRVMR